ncbi:MAG: hypothetical protein ABI606_05205 [Rhodoferax sp.]
MTYFAQGFLSEPFDEVRGTVREQYASWRDLFLRLNEQCVTAQHELSINADVPRDLLGGALFARTLASTQPAHATVSDLVSHLVTDERGNVTELKNEPEVKGQAATWAFAIEIHIRAAIAVGEIFYIHTVDIETHKNALRILVVQDQG